MCIVGESLHGGPERPLRETTKVKLGLHWDPKILEVRNPWDICQVELHTVIGARQREQCMLQIVKLEGQSHLNLSPSARELEALKFALLSFEPAMVQYFLTILKFLPFCIGHIYSML